MLIFGQKMCKKIVGKLLRTLSEIINRNLGEIAGQIRRSDQQIRLFGWESNIGITWSRIDFIRLDWWQLVCLNLSSWMNNLACHQEFTVIGF